MTHRVECSYISVAFSTHCHNSDGSAVNYLALLWSEVQRPQWQSSCAEYLRPLLWKTIYISVATTLSQSSCNRFSSTASGEANKIQEPMHLGWLLSVTCLLVLIWLWLDAFWSPGRHNELVRFDTIFKSSTQSNLCSALQLTLWYQQESSHTKPFVKDLRVELLMNFQTTRDAIGIFNMSISVFWRDWSPAAVDAPYEAMCCSKMLFFH